MEKGEKVPPEKQILTISFNQGYECFVCGTAKGFYIFSGIPFNVYFYRDFNSEIKIIEMLYCTNILALVGTGSNPTYPPSKVIIWDDHQTKIIGEINFKSDVKGVRLRKDKIAVALEKKVYIYNCHNLKIFEMFDTEINPLGLIAMSVTGGLIVISLGTNKGEIRIMRYDEQTNIEKAAHKNSVVCLALTSDAKICATASVKGTLIRLFSTETGDMLKELRRGVEDAQITSISFAITNNLVMCSTSKGAINIFSTDQGANEEKKIVNKKSSLSFMKWMIGYFGSEWSFAQLKITDKDTVVGFSKDNQVIAVSMTGKYYLAELDLVKGGDCKLIESKPLFD